MHIHHFHNSLLGFADTKSLAEITALCRHLSNSMGFDAFIYALRTPSGFSEAQLTTVNGYPDAWLAHYFSKEHYKHDPIVKHCSEHTVPVCWDDPSLFVNSQSRQVMQEAADFGLAAGISMPVHSPHGELGILSFAIGQTNDAAKALTQQALPYVQLLAGYLHEAVRRVCLPVVKQSQTLTSREVECLCRVADGKSSWEIGALLGLSERTVNFHINNSMAKLQVYNRQHAVAKATLTGMIRPSPF
ncbi:MAG: LuxR family transcriptional regulator [Paraglaciecola sp.]|nr:LuxR family transcriptional regulator [Paraglaciecola sp.]NCT49060.1 LuxR family transcriptional regulator [Paraglaciecola sp.]